MTPHQFSDCYDPLTPAEMLVVQAICAGYTNDQDIAMQLGGKPRTVGSHLSRIYEKLKR